MVARWLVASLPGGEMTVNRTGDATAEKNCRNKSREIQ